MRESREGHIPRTVIFAAHPVIEAADFQSFLALVEHNIFQCQLHRAPD